MAAKWAALDSEILKNGNWNFDTCEKKRIDRISWTDSEDHGYLGWTALHHSSEHGDLLLNLFIFLKVSKVMTYWLKNWNAGHLEITKYLLEKGADIKAIDGNGETALHHASLFGNYYSWKCHYFWKNAQYN